VLDAAFDHPKELLRPFADVTHPRGATGFPLSAALVDEAGAELGGLVLDVVRAVGLVEGDDFGVGLEEGDLVVVDPQRFLRVRLHGALGCLGAQTQEVLQRLERLARPRHLEDGTRALVVEASEKKSQHGVDSVLRVVALQQGLALPSRLELPEALIDQLSREVLQLIGTRTTRRRARRARFVERADRRRHRQTRRGRRQRRGRERDQQKRSQEAQLRLPCLPSSPVSVADLGLGLGVGLPSRPVSVADLGLGLGLVRARRSRHDVRPAFE